MPRTEQDTIGLIHTCLSDHKEHWGNRQEDMRRLRSAYLTRFFEDVEYDQSTIRVETSDAYTFIESYIASLFEKSPAVEVDSMKTDVENVELARASVNSWLEGNRKALENGSRLALIYPMSFFKMSPAVSEDPLQRVRIRALEPWQVILDRDADLWEEQRYCGHHYYIPLQEAKEKYGNKRFTPVSKPNYFHDYDGTVVDRTNSLPDEYQYIEVVEFYDFMYDMLYVYSPNWKDGGLLEKRTIPLRTYDNEPLVPIVGLYYSRVPDKPMDGYSTLGRVYDQIFEKNIIRTFWANAIRRDSRQFLVKEGAMDEEALAKITAGVDGAIIPVDNETLDGIIREVPVTPLSTNFDRYLQMVESDIQRGSIISPNTKGIATKATATEVTALAQYTASEIGRMARERDEAIEDIAQIYTRMMVYTLEEDDKPVIMVGKKPRYVTADALDHKFRYFALDQAATPLSKELKKRQLLELLPVLSQLGVPPEKIREEIVREFNIPDTFLEVPEPVDTQVRTRAEAVEGQPTNSAEVLAQELVSQQRSIPLPIPE